MPQQATKRERAIPKKQKPVTPPASAVWISSTQLLDRYGGRSMMWLVRKINEKLKGKENPAFDPAFPKPTYFGRLMFFRIADLEQYEKLSVTRGRAKVEA